MGNASCLIKAVLPAREGEKFLRLVCRAGSVDGGAGLSGVGLVPGQFACVFPGNYGVRIKSVAGGDLPGGCVIMVKGVKRAVLRVGGLIATGPVEECREALVMLEEGCSGPKSPVVRVQGGLHGGFNAPEWGCFVPEAEIRPVRGVAGMRLMRVRFAGVYPLLPGVRFEMLPFVSAGLRNRSRDGGCFTRVVFPGAVPGGWPGGGRRAFSFETGRDAIEQIIHVNMALRGFVFLHSGFCIDRAFVSAYGEGGGIEVVRGVGTAEGDNEVQSWLVSREMLEEIRRYIYKAVRRPGGVHCKALGGGLRDVRVPDVLLLAIAREMVEAGEIRQGREWFLSCQPGVFSPFHRSLLERVRGCGYNGLSVREVRSPAEGRALEEMRRDSLVCGGSQLWLSRDVLEKIAERLLGGMERGRKLTMRDVKASLDGSRSFRIEVLSILEADGRLSPLRDSVRTVQ